MTPYFDKTILRQMRRHADVNKMTDTEIRKGIIRGREIIEEDERLLNERNLLRPHFLMSREDKTALWLASLYNTIQEVNASRNKNAGDD